MESSRVATINLAAMLEASVSKHGDRSATRHRDDKGWRTATYADFGARVREVARGLVERSVERGDRVGLFAPNRPEWAIVDFALQRVGAVTVPIYATDTAGQAEAITVDAGLKLCFVGDQVHVDKVATFAAARGLAVVAFDATTHLPGPGDLHFDDLVALGRDSRAETDVAARLAVARPDDVATIIYTSGTTGDRKGAMLTHANFFSQFAALDERFEVDSNDRSLCFLPLSHVYERAWSYYVFRQGAENCYIRDPKDVVVVMGEVRPTAMVSVPRLYEKIFATLLQRVDEGSPAKRRLFRWALGVGGRYQRARRAGGVGPALRAQHALADRLVLTKIREVVGGDKNFMSVGGAPLAKEVEEMFLAAGLLICQGFGLTETSPMVTCNAPGAFRFGTVGRPIPGCEVKVAATGEVLVRGANVMKGYYGKPAETAAAFEDGWFKTGDIGVLDPDGYLRITDRLKDIIITSQGKNVAPQHIEGMFVGHPLVEQVVVIGDRRKYVAALIVPAFAALEAHARSAGVAFSSREELCANPDILALYDKAVRDRSKDLAGYEQIKRFALLPRELTQEGGELTPTLKVKRRVVEQRYAAVIDRLYASGDEPTAARKPTGEVRA